MEKYKLLHDTPTSKAGDIFEATPESPYYWNKESQVTYEKRVVEQYNNYWFKKIVENVYPEGILEFSQHNGRAWAQPSYESYYSWARFCLDQKFPITKVKNRNGEVFSIGDKVKELRIGHNSETFKIKEFGIYHTNSDTGHLIAFKEKDSFRRIDTLVHCIPKTYTAEEILSAISYAENNYRNTSPFKEMTFVELAMTILKCRLNLEPHVAYVVTDESNTFKKDSEI